MAKRDFQCEDCGTRFVELPEETKARMERAELRTCPGCKSTRVEEI